VNRIFIIARWEYLRRVKSKSFLFSLLLPFIVFILAALPEILNRSAEGPQRSAAVISEDPRFADRLLHIEAEQMNPVPAWSFTAVALSPDRDLLVKELLHARAFDAVILPGDPFLQTAAAEIYYRDLGPEDRQGLKNLLSDLLYRGRLDNSGLDPSLIRYIDSPPDLQMLSIDKSGEVSLSDPLTEFIVPFVFLFVLIISLLTSSQALISSLIEERSSRISEIILSSAKALELMAGKILGMGLLGLTQLAFYLFILMQASGYLPLSFAADLNIPVSDMLWYILFFIAGYFLYVGIYISLGTLFDNERDAMQISGFFSLFLIAPVYFVNFMLENPQALVTDLLSLIPLMTPFFMIARIGIGDPGTLYISGMFIYLLVWILITLFISSLIFRSAILLYGKRVNLPELFRLLKNNS